MAELLEGEYELNGFVFGGSKPGKVWVERLDIDPAKWTHGHAVNPRTGRRSFVGGATEGRDWNFTFSAMTGDLASGRVLLEQASAAFSPLSLFDESDKLLELRYKRGGVVRKVYGRPEPLDFDQNGFFRQGSWTATAKFVAESPFSYGDEELLVLPIVATSAGGVAFPTPFPWVLAPGDPRAGIVVVEGSVPTPFKVKIKGPIQNPRVYAPGWEIGLTTNLLAGQSVTIDTRTMTVLRNDGKSLAGTLTRKSILEDASLVPGNQEIIFSGVDTMGLAEAEIRWSSAHHGY